MCARPLSLPANSHTLGAVPLNGTCKADSGPKRGLSGVHDRQASLGEQEGQQACPQPELHLLYRAHNSAASACYQFARLTPAPAGTSGCTNIGLYEQSHLMRNVHRGGHGASVRRNAAAAAAQILRVSRVPCRGGGGAGGGKFRRSRRSRRRRKDYSKLRQCTERWTGGV